MWTPSPLLRPVPELQQAIDRVVLRSIRLLRAALGDVALYHVGSSALLPLLTNGTVDLLLLAEPDKVIPLQASISTLTELHAQELRVNLTVSDKHKPNNALRIRHLLATQPMRMGELLGIQKQFIHRIGKRYPQAKAQFFATLLQEEQNTSYDQDNALPPQIELVTERLHLCTPTSLDAKEYVAYLLANREFHQRYSSNDPKNFRADTWRQFFGNETLLRLQRESLTFLVRRQDTGATIGACHFSGFLWQRYQHCSVGYHLAKTEAGRGYMTEAVSAAVAYVAKQWGVHRVQALYDPANIKSAKLLKRVGFRVEGAMESYLHLNDEWHDCTMAAMHW